MHVTRLLVPIRGALASSSEKSCFKDWLTFPVTSDQDTLIVKVISNKPNQPIIVVHAS